MCDSDHGPSIMGPSHRMFHSLIYTNNTSSATIALVDLWYDFPNGRNFNIIQNQLGKLLYDLEWDNGTSYYYTLDSNKECKALHFDVGVLRPDWLDSAEYLGREMMDWFDCNVWKKVDFITYYEDVVTKRPVHWVFFTQTFWFGRSAHVMTFEVGAVLEDEKWQAPVYCFEGKVEVTGRSGGIGSVTAEREYSKNGEERRGLRGLMGF
ncbi:Uncharacterized protein QJS10_CPA16g00803 [Acorus calamus]|uniref:Uncharacterized protein n=1 Tax=Acorus calamus TaxID=4465 RepID=A0AAV9D0P8_ACOCL|nr:Uncharacterized protein QJS10_CPA16g00803 [Acorus calamus]